MTPLIADWIDPLVFGLLACGIAAAVIGGLAIDRYLRGVSR
jgi:hypothetical protein